MKLSTDCLAWSTSCPASKHMTSAVGHDTRPEPIDSISASSRIPSRRISAFLRCISFSGPSGQERSARSSRSIAASTRSSCADELVTSGYLSIVMRVSAAESIRASASALAYLSASVSRDWLRPGHDRQAR